jgi:hypothetical protein
MMVVKISHTSGAAQNVPARIRITRPAFTSDCRGRYVTDYNLFANELIRAEVNTEVGIAEYIYYHKTRSDIGQEAIYGFHLDYRDYKGTCIKTDDKKNGNRQQFLFGNDRQPDNSLVLANIQQNVTAVVQALGAEQYVKKLWKSRSSLHDLVTNYLRNGQMETHLYPYELASYRCISFPVNAIYPGDTVTVTLNDLEQRDNTGNLVPSHARRESSFYIRALPNAP